ncbi:MAG: SMP-30/gluconolactonase/LRE family protein [Tannerella sp.]|jgi:enterochelin esterase-like enzyme|nr:SMP-30/gluconolactonase/LRE family protein [Tannerella sp.]
MNLFKSSLVLFMLCSLAAFAQDIPNTKEPYDPARDSVPEERKGVVMERSFSGSALYPGTKRSYRVYVPAAYTPDKPACLYVGMDGISFDAPTVFDNLIATGEMPVTIGVFVTSGTVYDADGEVIRYNRSNEFDKTDDTFVRFLTGELLPDVEKQTTPDGRPIRLSKDPNDRMIAGNSSGAICAFTAAWQRPDMFSRVFSAIGTYVPMRGGNEYPTLIRKTEPKPIRIFLQDGNKDTWNPLFGSWFDANLNMASALSFAGYEVNHVWGTGGHDGVHAHAIFPDVMRWLWKGWPHKVQCGPSKNNLLEHILDNESKWETVEISFVPQGALFSDAQGDLFIRDESGTVHVFRNGREPAVKQAGLSPAETLLACSDQKLYSADAKGNINVYKNGKKRTIARNLSGAEGLIVTGAGDLYLAQRLPGNERIIWLLRENGNKTIVDKLMYGGVQLALSPDHRMLMSSEENSHWIYNYTVRTDGTISNGQRWYWLHNSDNYDFEARGDMAFDIEGNLYVATSMGVQVCDPNGRVRAILTLPSGSVSTLCFAGENTLYVVSGGKLYSRRMNVKGVTPDRTPMKVQSQGAG